MQWEGSTAWLTGASSGIGEALAYALSARGVQLILSARRVEVLEEVRARCARPETHHIIPLDLSAPEALQQTAAETVAVYGPIDLLVNNGGISQRALAKDTDLAVDRQIMEVNYFGAVALTKAVLPDMLKRGQGHIAVISSIAGKVGPPYRTAYAASKHALHGFFEALRAEVWDDGLRVTVVCPGFIHTNISRNALKGDGALHAQMDDNQAQGLSAAACAQQILRAIDAEKAEVLIGGKELMGVRLQRFAPGLLRRILRNRKHA